MKDSSAGGSFDADQVWVTLLKVWLALVRSPAASRPATVKRFPLPSSIDGRVPARDGHVGLGDVLARRRVEDVGLLRSGVRVVRGRAGVRGVPAGDEQLAVGQERVAGAERVPRRATGLERLGLRIPEARLEVARRERARVVAGPGDEEDLAGVEQRDVHGAHRRRGRGRPPFALARGRDQCRDRDQQPRPERAAPSLPSGEVCHGLRRAEAPFAAGQAPELVRTTYAPPMADDPKSFFLSSEIQQYLVEHGTPPDRGAARTHRGDRRARRDLDDADLAGAGRVHDAAHPARRRAQRGRGRDVHRLLGAVHRTWASRRRAPALLRRERGVDVGRARRTGSRPASPTASS